MKPKVLHLTLKKEWFDLICCGKKTTEYRTIKDYWTKRLLDSSLKVKEYDEIYFRNGYSTSSPFMRVKWLSTEKENFAGKLCYAIKLGEILEVKTQS